MLNITDEIKEETVRIRKAFRTKLPDSIIIATSLYLDIPLITSDSAFKNVAELSLIYYEK